MIPYRIYLSGGGVTVSAHIGALQELSKHISLETVKEWMGVSAGGFISMCLCIGYTLEELEEFCLNFDFNHIKEVDSIPGLVLNYGLDTGDRLYRMITACLHIKGLSSEFTFKECQEKYNISLRIVATDLNKGKPFICSPYDTPNYSIANAIRASMSVPLYYQPFVCPETGHFLVDGAVISNYPLFVLSKEEQARTLGILIRTSVEPKETIEFEEYLLRPLSIMYVNKMECESTLYSSHCIQIMLGQVNIIDFSLTKEVKQETIQKGKEAVHTYMKMLPRVKRRNSL
jgi:NTE family protein